MNGQAAKKRWSLLWLVAFLIGAGIAGYGLVLQSRAVALEKQRNALQAELIGQQQRLERLKELVSQVREIQRQQSAETKELKKLSKPVKTRDQFLVTQGNKIVRKLAVYAPSGERRLCFYVPAGKHRLVYSIREFLGTSAETAAALANWGRDHRLLPETATINLQSDTVFELRASVDKSTHQRVDIRLLGQDDLVIHEDAFPLSFPALQGLGNWQNDSEVFASYPNELRSAGDAKSHVSAHRSAPVTPLLTFTLDQLGGRGQESKGRVKMRFWIDSESAACMSDVSVAVSYKFLVDNLKYPTQLTPLQSFEQTFQPYDGSGRYYFTDNYFPPASPTETAK